MLKPGAMFGCTDWVMTKNFDPAIEKHRIIRDQIERGNGIARMPLISDVRNGLKECGFEVTFEEQMEAEAGRVPGTIRSLDRLGIRLAEGIS